MRHRPYVYRRSDRRVLAVDLDRDPILAADLSILAGLAGLTAEHRVTPPEVEPDRALACVDLDLGSAIQAQCWVPAWGHPAWLDGPRGWWLR